MIELMLFFCRWIFNVFKRSNNVTWCAPRIVSLFSKYSTLSLTTPEDSYHIFPDWKKVLQLFWCLKWFVHVSSTVTKRELHTVTGPCHTVSVNIRGTHFADSFQMFKCWCKIVCILSLDCTRNVTHPQIFIRYCRIENFLIFMRIPFSLVTRLKFQVVIYDIFYQTLKQSCGFLPYGEVVHFIYYSRVRYLVKIHH